MKSLKFILFYLLALSVAVVHAHEGEHRDAPANAAQADARSRVEAATETFELVGVLQGAELAFLIDRFETNEPVLGGKLEVEANGMKANAPFRADHGDYAITDPAFLQALAKPGAHAMVFTLAAADESDLLEGTLEVKAAQPVDDHTHFPWVWTLIGLLAVLAAIALLAKLRRARISTGD